MAKPSKKLLDQMRDAIQRKHYAIRSPAGRVWRETVTVRRRRGSA